MTKLHQNWTIKSRVIHVRISIRKQHQTMMSSVTRVKLIKTKVIYRYHSKGVWNQVHQIRITKSKVIHIQIPVQKWEKLKSGKKFSGLQKGAISVLLIEADFRDYQSGQDGLQIGEALRISNWGQKITIRGRDLKLGQRDFKLGQRLQIGARRISNQDRDYDAEQR